MTTAIAISNNDMVYLHWHVADKIPQCLGFSVIRHDAVTDEDAPLPAMVGFKADDHESEDAGHKSRIRMSGPCKSTRGRIYSPSEVAPTGTRSCR